MFSVTKIFFLTYFQFTQVFQNFSAVCNVRKKRRFWMKRGSINAATFHIF